MLPVIMTKITPREQSAESARSAQSAAPPGWQAGGEAPLLCRFTAADLSGQLDLSRPGQGVRLVAAEQPTELLAVRLPTGCVEPADRWIRGADAVAIHEPSDSRRLRITSLWRLQPGPAACTLELVLSAQTAIVCSDGAVAVDCRLTAAAVSLGSSGETQTDWTAPATAADGEQPISLPRQRLPDTAVLCLLFHQAVGARSLAVLVRRDEGRQVMLWQRAAAGPKPPRFALTTWFFPTLIEKGVLHRGRIQAVLGPGKNDRDWAAAAASRLARQPPLLQ